MSSRSRNYARFTFTAAMLVAACKTPSSQTEEAETSASTSSSVTQPKINGMWTPIVSLKDLTDTFPGDHEVPRPKDGWWVSPIHANLMADGKVLVTGWSRPKENSCGDHEGRRNGTSFILDTNNLQVTKSTTLSINPLDELPRKKGDVLYCAGHAPLPDGRILFMGGARYTNLGDVEYPDPFKQDEFGLNYARIFNPRSGKFSPVRWSNPGGPDKKPTADWDWYEKGSMWYPTNTRLPGGKILINGGYSKWISVGDPGEKKWGFQNNSVTIFDPKAFDAQKDPWQVWVPHNKSVREVSIDAFDYPRSFLLPKPVMLEGLPRHVAIFGGLGWHPEDKSYKPGITLLSLDEKVPEAKRFARPKKAQRPDDGMMHETTSTMLADGSILIMGGGANAQAEGQRIDIYNPYQDSWQEVPTGITRNKPSSTLLPDGKVLIINGEESWDTLKNIGDRTQPTLFDPSTNKTVDLAPWTDDHAMRGYHSISLLLKDGRVLIGGGRIYEGGKDKIGTNNPVGAEGKYRIGCERPELRIFSPPYLFKGPRPVIANAPTQVAAGQNFTVKFNGPKLKSNGGVVLMALGAFTHGFDQNQRIVPLTVVTQSNGAITVASPQDNFIAPEGEYNLFLISDAGVPSVASTLKITSQ